MADRQQAMIEIFKMFDKDGSNSIDVSEVGSLLTSLGRTPKQDEIKKLVKHILGWLTAIFEEGRAKKVFYFDIDARTKALMIVTNMLAAVQLTRLTTKKDFEKIKQTIINDLTNNK